MRVAQTFYGLCVIPQRNWIVAELGLWENCANLYHYYLIGLSYTIVFSCYGF